MNPILDFAKGLVSPITNIADKMIMDKDKYAEIQLKKAEFKHDEKTQLLAITTTPKIDAFVKLLYALKDVIIPMLRPLGSAGMTLFGAYMHYKGTPMDTGLQILFDGAFPAWGASRHVNKQTETKAKEKTFEEEFG